MNFTPYPPGKGGGEAVDFGAEEEEEEEEEAPSRSFSPTTWLSVKGKEDNEGYREREEEKRPFPETGSYFATNPSFTWVSLFSGISVDRFKGKSKG